MFLIMGPNRGNLELVSQLMKDWEVVRAAPNQDGLTNVIVKLAELFEIELGVYLQMNPDPFDDRHPSRVEPEAIFGLMLKTIFRNERLVDEVVTVYCQRNDESLNTAACRLLLGILPGLETVIFQEEGFVSRLFEWAENSPNPLNAYATGLLAAAMHVPDVADFHRNKSAYLIPQKLSRLHKFSMEHLRSTRNVVVHHQSSETENSEDIVLCAEVEDYKGLLYPANMIVKLNPSNGLYVPCSSERDLEDAEKYFDQFGENDVLMVTKYDEGCFEPVCAPPFRVGMPQYCQDFYERTYHPYVRHMRLQIESSETAPTPTVRKRKPRKKNRPNSDAGPSSIDRNQGLHAESVNQHDPQNIKEELNTILTSQTPDAEVIDLVSDESDSEVVLSNKPGVSKNGKSHKKTNLTSPSKGKKSKCNTSGKNISKRTISETCDSSEDLAHSLPTPKRSAANLQEGDEKQCDTISMPGPSHSTADDKYLSMPSINTIVPANSSSIEEKVFNEDMSSDLINMESITGSYDIYPLTRIIEQRFILQYLTPMAEYSDLISIAVEQNSLLLVLRYIDKNLNPDIRLCFEATKYLASLMCHKKFALEFLNLNGLRYLLKVPLATIAATGVSMCLYYLSHMDEALERISLMTNYHVGEFVRYGLELLRSTHDSCCAHATFVFNYAFAYKNILKKFDDEDGMHKIYNVLTTLDIFETEDVGQLSDDRVFANRTTTRYLCSCLNTYFEACLAFSNSSKPHSEDASNKSLNLLDMSEENLEFCIEVWRENISPMLSWKPVQDFLDIEGVYFLLELIHSYFDISYSGRLETVRYALNILKICSLNYSTQLAFCDKLKYNERDIQNEHPCGIYVLFQAAKGAMFPSPYVQRAALEVIINCVLIKCPTSGVKDLEVGTPRKKQYLRNSEDVMSKLWKHIRINNGIIILINLLSEKSPITDADSIRALACRALYGLTRADPVKQLISKLPLVTDGILLDLMKAPLLQDKCEEHAQFCKYGVLLLEQVTGTVISSVSDASIRNVTKSEVVANTRISYNETQLLQLILNHLSSKGYSESAHHLQQEMAKKSHGNVQPTNHSFSFPSTFKNLEIRVKKKKTSPYPNYAAATTGILTQTIPMFMQLGRKQIPPVKVIQLTKSTPSRLQKSQICSGNYLQSPAMKRLDSSNLFMPHNSSEPSQTFSGNFAQSPTTKRLGTANAPMHYCVTERSTTLQSIITEYLRKQHDGCKMPMGACPEFDLFCPHKCPEPKQKNKPPTNFTTRNQRKQIYGHDKSFGYSSVDRKHIFSKFRLVRTIRDPEERADFATSSFIKYPSTQYRNRLLVGTITNARPGTVTQFNLNTGEEMWNGPVLGVGMRTIDSSKFNPLVLTSVGSRVGNTILWTIDTHLTELHTFSGVRHMEFSKFSSTKAIATKPDSAAIFDIGACMMLQTFQHGESGNGYVKNIATFDYRDELVMTDGLLWDIKGGNIVHKLDKLNARFNGIFHPNGREIISNSEIWDLRTFKLLQTVPALDQCKITFNDSGNIMYGVVVIDIENSGDDRGHCFYSFDPYDYSTITTVDVKKAVFSLSTDISDRYIATIESQNASDSYGEPPGVDCVCRLYEIGRTKDENESGESEDNYETDDDDVDDDDDHVNDGNNNDDTDNEIEGHGDDDVDISFEIEAGSSDSMDEDEALFSLNAED